MMKQAKRVIALLLSIVILVGLVPGHVFAEGETLAAGPVVDALVMFSDLHTSKNDYKQSTLQGVMTAVAGLPISSVTSCGDAFSVNEDSGKYDGSTSTLTGYIQVKENIRALREAGVMVSLNLSITPNNCGDLPQIYADAVELGVNVRASSYMYPSIRVHEECYGWGNRLSPEEAARCSVEWDLLRMSPEEIAAADIAEFLDKLKTMQIL